MPRKNIIRQYLSDSYYHIYSRGVNKEKTFRSEKDIDVFVSLLKRYLSPESKKNVSRRLYKNYSDEIELLTYAIMPNHFHLLIYQKENERTISDFMKSLMTSYSMYFNKEHKRVGPVFQSTYKAVLIQDDAYLEHISRYIHLNPSNWNFSKHTSIDYYRSDRKANWINPSRVLDQFPSVESYMDFLASYDPEQEDKLYDVEPED